MRRHQRRVFSVASSGASEMATAAYLIHERFTGIGECFVVLTQATIRFKPVNGRSTPRRLAHPRRTTETMACTILREECP